MKPPLLLATCLLAGCVHPCQCSEIEDAALAMAEAGRVEEAAALLAEGAKLATKPDHRDHMLFQEGLILARAGLVEKAFAVWDPLYETTANENIRGRIVYEKGMLARRSGDMAEARRQFLLLVTEHPENGLALTGLFRLEKIVMDEEGDDAVRILLEGLLEGALETTFGDDVLWELYAWHHGHGEDDKAEKYLLAIRYSYPYPTGERAYETLLALSEMMEAQERWEEALGYLEEITGPIGKAPVIGSSGESGKAEAFLRMAHIYEDHLEKPGTALNLYLRVAGIPEIEDVSDDALLEAARLLVEMGKTAEACKRIDDLLEKYPYSNKRKKAKKLAVAAGCNPG